MAFEATLCHVLSRDRLLLKKATRGISVGKWNAPGGIIEPGETPEQNVLREVLEETGFTIRKPLYHGVLRYHMDGTDFLHTLAHLFSAREFSGQLRPSSEGEVRWFEITKIPWDDMWADDRYWLQLMLEGKRFNADFYYDKENRDVIKYQTRLK